MELNTEVLIVGSGPTGLMLACQLLRFGISFQIIDKQADRAHESRAFGIQAKSMEIFQNLGIANDFMEKSMHDVEPYFFVNGKLKLILKLNQLKMTDTPFPSIFFLPQSETEKILIHHIEKCGINIQRQTSLEKFYQTDHLVKSVIKNVITGETQDITSRYIVGCDGAHSTVRKILAIPFVGAAYEQNFFLADIKVDWPVPLESKFMLFFDKAGFFLHAPLTKDLSRIIGAKISSSPQEPSTPLKFEEMDHLAKKITHMNLTLSNPKWMSRFHLHHRAINQYQKGHAFLAGDAAHIHSPVGAQGMNTGLQDATNLAWKIALVLKNNSPKELLNTYQAERESIGRKLSQTTDKFFGILTSPNKILTHLRPLFLSLMLKLISKSLKIQTSIFWFISELGIHYQKNKFVYEKISHADSIFLAGPAAGHRAPDAPCYGTSLFEMFKENPFNILILQNLDKDKTVLDENKIAALEENYQDWIKFHKFNFSPDTYIIFDRYHISHSGLYVIRPDGYIGFRDSKLDIDELYRYLKKLLGT